MDAQAGRPGRRAGMNVQARSAHVRAAVAFAVLIGSASCSVGRESRIDFEPTSGGPWCGGLESAETNKALADYHYAFKGESSPPPTSPAAALVWSDFQEKLAALAQAVGSPDAESA